jgi:hypothetical protein
VFCALAAVTVRAVVSHQPGQATLTKPLSALVVTTEQAAVLLVKVEAMEVLQVYQLTLQTLLEPEMLVAVVVAQVGTLVMEVLEVTAHKFLPQYQPRVTFEPLVAAAEVWASTVSIEVVRGA